MASSASTPLCKIIWRSPRASPFGPVRTPSGDAFLTPAKRPSPLSGRVPDSYQQPTPADSSVQRGIKRQRVNEPQPVAPVANVATPVSYSGPPPAQLTEERRRTSVSFAPLPIEIDATSLPEGYATSVAPPISRPPATIVPPIGALSPGRKKPGPKPGWRKALLEKEATEADRGLASTSAGGQSSTPVAAKSAPIGAANVTAPGEISTAQSSVVQSPPVKRKPGRPRKHPRPEDAQASPPAAGKKSSIADSVHRSSVADDISAVPTPAASPFSPHVRKSKDADPVLDLDDESFDADGEYSKKPLPARRGPRKGLRGPLVQVTKSSTGALQLAMGTRSVKQWRRLRQNWGKLDTKWDVVEDNASRQAFEAKDSGRPIKIVPTLSHGRVLVSRDGSSSSSARETMYLPHDATTLLDDPNAPPSLIVKLKMPVKYLARLLGRSKPGKVVDRRKLKQDLEEEEEPDRYLAAPPVLPDEPARVNSRKSSTAKSDAQTRPTSAVTSSRGGPDQELEDGLLIAAMEQSESRRIDRESESDDELRYDAFDDGAGEATAQRAESDRAKRSRERLAKSGAKSNTVGTRPMARRSGGRLTPPKGSRAPLADGLPMGKAGIRKRREAESLELDDDLRLMRAGAQKSPAASEDFSSSEHDEASPVQPMHPSTKTAKPRAAPARTSTSDSRQAESAAPSAAKPSVLIKFSGKSASQSADGTSAQAAAPKTSASGKPSPFDRGSFAQTMQAITAKPLASLPRPATMPSGLQPSRASAPAPRSQSPPQVTFELPDLPAEPEPMPEPASVPAPAPTSTAAVMPKMGVFEQARPSSGSLPKSKNAPPAPQPATNKVVPARPATITDERIEAEFRRIPSPFLLATAATVAVPALAPLAASDMQPRAPVAIAPRPAAAAIGETAKTASTAGLAPPAANVAKLSPTLAAKQATAPVKGTAAKGPATQKVATPKTTPIATAKSATAPSVAAVNAAASSNVAVQAIVPASLQPSDTTKAATLPAVSGQVASPAAPRASEQQAAAPRPAPAATPRQATAAPVVPVNGAPSSTPASQTTPAAPQVAVAPPPATSATDNAASNAAPVRITAPPTAHTLMTAMSKMGKLRIPIPKPVPVPASGRAPAEAPHAQSAVPATSSSTPANGNSAAQAPAQAQAASVGWVAANRPMPASLSSATQSSATPAAAVQTPVQAAATPGSGSAVGRAAPGTSGQVQPPSGPRSMSPVQARQSAPAQAAAANAKASPVVAPPTAQSAPSRLPDEQDSRPVPSSAAAAKALASTKPSTSQPAASPQATSNGTTGTKSAAAAPSTTNATAPSASNGNGNGVAPQPANSPALPKQASLPSPAIAAESATAPASVDPLALQTPASFVSPPQRPAPRPSVVSPGRSPIQSAQELQKKPEDAASLAQQPRVLATAVKSSLRAFPKPKSAAPGASPTAPSKSPTMVSATVPSPVVLPVVAPKPSQAPSSTSAPVVPATTSESPAARSQAATAASVRTSVEPATNPSAQTATCVSSGPPTSPARHATQHSAASAQKSSSAAEASTAQSPPNAAAPVTVSDFMQGSLATPPLLQATQLASGIPQQPTTAWPAANAKPSTGATVSARAAAPIQNASSPPTAARSPAAVKSRPSTTVKSGSAAKSGPARTSLLHSATLPGTRVPHPNIAAASAATASLPGSATKSASPAIRPAGTEQSGPASPLASLAQAKVAEAASTPAPAPANPASAPPLPVIRADSAGVSSSVPAPTSARANLQAATAAVMATAAAQAAPLSFQSAALAAQVARYLSPPSPEPTIEELFGSSPGSSSPPPADAPSAGDDVFRQADLRENSDVKPDIAALVSTEKPASRPDTADSDLVILSGSPARTAAKTSSAKAVGNGRTAALARVGSRVDEAIEILSDDD